MKNGFMENKIKFANIKPIIYSMLLRLEKVSVDIFDISSVINDSMNRMIAMIGPLKVKYSYMSCFLK